jgi:hypothetical protein
MHGQNIAGGLWLVGLHIPPYPHVYDVTNYGAVGNGTTDDAAAIQAAISAAAQKGGGTVYFPAVIGCNAARYAVANTLHLGGANTPVSGIILLAERRSLTQPQAILVWTGPRGGTILEVRMAHSCALENLGFDGAGLANYCIQFHYVAGDGLQCEHIDCRDLYLSNALIYNELIGEPDGAASSGDASLIAHWNCYYQQSVSGVRTTAHVRHRSVNALNNAWYNCQFYGDNSYPLHAISIGSGRIGCNDCLCDIIGDSDFYMDNDPGIAPGSIVCIGQESQSKKLLRTSTDGTVAIRSTVFIGAFHNDIENDGDPDSIEWDLHGPGLVLVGCNFSSDRGSGGNVNVLSPRVDVYTEGCTFDIPGKGFVGYVERVQGTYRDGNGNCQNLGVQLETTGWGKGQNVDTGAVVTGAGGTFSTITAGEYLDIALNGTPPVRTMFQASDTTVTAVLNRINAAFESTIVANVAPPGFNQLRLRASQSIQIVGGSAGTLAKIGLTVGTTAAAGIMPVALLEGRQCGPLKIQSTLPVGDDELCGMIVVAINTGIGTAGISCIFQAQGLAHATYKESTDPGSQFSTIEGHAGTINFYWDNMAGAYTVENQLESGLFVALQMMGIGQH